MGETEGISVGRIYVSDVATANKMCGLLRLFSGPRTNAMQNLKEALKAIHAAG